MPPPGPPPFLLLLPLLLLLSATATSAASAASAAAARGNTTTGSNHTTPATPTSPSPASSPTTSPTSSSPTSSPTTPSPTSSPSPSTPSTLDPKQLRALQSLNLPTSKDPCSPHPNAITLCDSSKPFRHLVSLSLSNCSPDLSLSFTALKSLSTLQSLSFSNCPSLSPIRFPSDLSLSLRSFTSIHSLRRLSGVWLSRFVNLTDLTVTNVQVNTSGLYVILGNMHKLRSLTISHANLTGYLPKHLHLNLTHVDLSGNRLKGKIPTSFTLLDNLESFNLSSNEFNGEIPSEFGDLISLRNVSLASNSFSGPIPDSMSAIPGLVHLDLSRNQLNGTIPRFFSKMKDLTHLNLANNGFQGVLPFNESFIKKLAVFKVGGNDNLCYNHSILSSKLKLGIAPCDKHGLPMSPPPAKGDSSAGDSESDSSDYDDSEGDNSSHKEGHHHGPKIADHSSPFAFRKDILQLTTSSLRSDGNRRGRPPQKSSSSGRTKKEGENKMPISADGKLSNSSNQEEVIALFKRIKSSISKGESVSTKKKNSSLSEDKPMADSVLDVLHQSSAEIKDTNSNKGRNKTWRRGVHKKEQGIQDNAPVADFKLTRPPSNFVKRSPIPSPSAPTPRGKVLQLNSGVGNTELKLPRVEKLKLPELKELAKARGIKGYSRLKKSELVELLRC